jgi:hypothetical protein
MGRMGSKELAALDAICQRYHQLPSERFRDVLNLIEDIESRAYWAWCLDDACSQAGAHEYNVQEQKREDEREGRVVQLVKKRRPW